MYSINQTRTNRRNTRKSTGPTSVTGEAASCQNAFETGIQACSLILPHESLADLEQLINEYYHHHRPTTPEARALVDDLIHCEWTLRRLRIAEIQIFQLQNDTPSYLQQKYHGEHTALQHRVDCTRRAILRTLAVLKRFRTVSAGIPSPTASQQTTSSKSASFCHPPSSARTSSPSPAPKSSEEAGKSAFRFARPIAASSAHAGLP